MDKNKQKLPIFYEQVEEAELIGRADKSALDEFVVCCLLDPKFPGFVKKIENVLNGVLKDE